jgi:hypothetical protein
LPPCARAAFVRINDSADHLGEDGDMDDPENLDSLLALYAQVCAEAGVEPLPEDEAREQARAMMSVLVPAFAVTFRQH